MDDLRLWVAWPINNQLRRLRLADVGIDETHVKDLFTLVSVDGLGLVSLDEETGEVRDAERSREGEAIGVPLVMIMLMLLRQSTPGGVPLWQPVVGIAGVLILTVFSIWVGGRIFRVGILMQGTSPKLGDLVRWAIRG